MKFHPRTVNDQHPDGHLRKPGNTQDVAGHFERNLKQPRHNLWPNCPQQTLKNERQPNSTGDTCIEGTWRYGADELRPEELPKYLKNSESGDNKRRVSPLARDFSYACIER